MRGRATKLLITRLLTQSMSLSSRCGVQAETAAGCLDGTARSIVRPSAMHARNNSQITRISIRSGSRLSLGSSYGGLGNALGCPVVPLHFQRKVNVWARSYNAEEALAPSSSPAGLPYSGKNFMLGSNPSALGSSTAVETEPVSSAVSSAVIMNGDLGSFFTDAVPENGPSMSQMTAGTSTSNNGSSSSTAEVVSSSSNGSENGHFAAGESELCTSPESAAAVAADISADASSSSSSSTTDGSSCAAPPGSSSSSSSSGSEEQPSSGGTGPAIRLLLQSGAAMLPHPDKAHRGGEDSFFIADHQSAVGVADGVGGWAEIGVDAGAYARLLMVHAKEAADAAVDDLAAGTLSPQAILESAFYRTNVQGSSTACVLVVNGTTLSASNLGDSGFVLVRDGVATFQCPQQQHNFNFPFQLGSADSMSDQPQAAMRFDLQLQPGDIIVTGSDGLWDNIFAEEAATIASKCRDKGETATTAAQVLCRYARMRASDAKYHSPFSYAAIQAGYVYLGGKMDDITVVVSYVSLPHSKL